MGPRAGAAIAQDQWPFLLELHPYSQILTPLSFAGDLALQASSIPGVRLQMILPDLRSEPPCWPFKNPLSSRSFPQHVKILKTSSGGPIRALDSYLEKKPMPTPTPKALIQLAQKEPKSHNLFKLPGSAVHSELTTSRTPSEVKDRHFCLQLAHFFFF